MSRFEYEVPCRGNINTFRDQLQEFLNMRTKSEHGIIPGSTILTEKPFVFVLKSSLQGERCDQCFQKPERIPLYPKLPWCSQDDDDNWCCSDEEDSEWNWKWPSTESLWAESKLSKCSGCKFVSYCDRDCQKAAWAMHKKECSNMKRVSPRVVPDAARLLARIIFKLKSGGDQEKSYFSKTGFRVFKDLMSHYTDIKKDEKRMQHFASLYNVLLEYIGDEGVPNSAELLGIYGRMVVNGFNILDPEMMSLGTGLYLGVSIIDHSCNPTAVAVFTGTTIHIRALRGMTTLNWDNVRITYVELLNTAHERQEELRATYYFLCQCSRCVDHAELELQRSMACKCGAAVPIFQKEEYGKLCGSCGAHIKPAQIDRFLEVSDLTNQHLQTMRAHDTAYLDVCKVCLEQQSDMFHPLNLLRVKALDFAFESAVQMGSWTEALRLGTELEPGYRRYYGDMHPLMGLLYLKLARLTLLLADKPSEALDWLKRAQHVLRVTHGERHPLWRDEVVPLFAQVLEGTQNGHSLL